MNIEKTLGLDGLDIRIRDYLFEHIVQNGFFVELGANDGISQSNTAILESDFGWTGILIEAVKPLYDKCVLNRQGSKVYNFACVDFGYDKPFIELIYSDLMSTPLIKGSDIQDPFGHAFSGAKWLGPNENVEKISVPVATLTKLLDLGGAPKSIEFLSLDVEGAELNVLKGIDFSRYKIKFIVVETRSLIRIVQFLSEYGYFVRAQLSVHDFLFERRRYI